MQDFIKIHENDNVIVALNTLDAGTTVTLDNGLTVTANTEIPAGPKMAIKDIKAGEEVLKYGYSIGFTKEDVKCGDWIHVHNLKTGLGDLLEYTYEPTPVEESYIFCFTFFHWCWLVSIF